MLDSLQYICFEEDELFISSKKNNRFLKEVYYDGIVPLEIKLAIPYKVKRPLTM